MADPDAASAALIAKLMAEENPYGDEGDYLEYNDDSDDGDYGKPKRKKKKKAPPKPKPIKAPKEPKSPKEPQASKRPPSAVDTKPQDGENDEHAANWIGIAAAAGAPATTTVVVEEFTETGRRKRKDTGAKREKARPWDETEERLFREALTLHGRDWHACAAHVGTRDHRAFTSHAQKYFIKLCLQGKQLPVKVRESGDGFTLSGKPLDPTSAAAKQYGFKPDTAGLSAEQLAEMHAAAEKEKARAREEKARAREEKALAKEEREEVRAAAAAERTANRATGGSKRAYTMKRVDVDRYVSSEDDAPPPEPTEYAKNRPRRDAAVASNFRDAAGGTLELHQMRKFSSAAPGSKTPNAQPFALTVSSDAMLIMDLHSHLCVNEVIGYLGGTWNAATRTVSIEKAFPGRGVASGSDVEMDPVCEVELKARVEAEKLTVVGWYHSHPVFQPTPSGVDVDNQLNYQALFRDAECDVEPFVGFIVGPYDVRLPSPTSEVTAFCAKRLKGGGGVRDVPYACEYAVTGGSLSTENDAAPAAAAATTMTTTAAVGDATIEAMKAVVIANENVDGRVNPTELWRPFATYLNGVAGGGPTTKLAKLRASLNARLPAGTTELEREDVLDGVAKQMQESWKLDLGY